jgi:purine-binding chemotaxis protein CheW
VLPSSFAQPQTNDRPSLEVLLIRLAGELYAVPSSKVREVVRYRPHTPVPGAPPILPGILSQRGLIVPVVELRPLLGLDVNDITRAARLVIMSHNDVDMAVLAEAVLDLASLPVDTIESVPAALDPTRARFLNGIAQYEEQPVAILDLDELIAGLRSWS